MQSCSSHSLKIKPTFGQIDLLTLKCLVLFLSHLMGYKHDTSLTIVVNLGRINSSLSLYHCSAEIQTKEESGNLMLQSTNSLCKIAIFLSRQGRLGGFS